MARFRRLSDLELSALGDEELVAYIRRARAAGELEAMRIAVSVFCYGMHDEIRSRVRMRMEREADADVDSVTGAVIEGVLLVEFRGESVGELRALISVILKRRIADYWRSLRGEVTEEPLVAEHEGEEAIWGEEPKAREEISAVWANDLIDRDLAGLSPPHRAVISHRLCGYSAKEAAERANNHFETELETPMTPENVDQIFSRFRRRLRDLIDEVEHTGRHDDTRSDDG